MSQGIDLARSRRVLIVKPSSMGDIVHTLPALHDLKTAFPHLEITWLANTEWLPLLEGHPQLKGVVEFPRQRLRGIGKSWASLRWLLDMHRHCQPDVTLDFQGLFRSGLISWFSRGRKRVGLSDSREGARWFHNFVVPVESSVHAVDRYRLMAAALGASTAAPAVFELPRGEALDRTLPVGFVALHPFSRGERKSLTVAQVGRLCEAIARPVVLLGRVDPTQRSQLRLPENCLDLLNQTSIAELIWCLRRAEATVSVDSGPMHLAAALRPETLLSVHTWSDPRKVGPYSRSSWVWKMGEIQRVSEMPAEVCGGAGSFDDEHVDGVANWVEASVSRD